MSSIVLYCGIPWDLNYSVAVPKDDKSSMTWGWLVRVRWEKYWKDKSLQEPAQEPLGTISKQLFDLTMCLLCLILTNCAVLGRSEDQPRSPPFVVRK